jgi:hypothetical protein
MNPIDIHLIIRTDDYSERVKIITGSTDYDFISQEYDLFNRLDDESGRFNLITIRLPEILLTGNDDVIDLMPQETESA